MQFPARHLFLGAPQFSHSVVSKSLRPHGLKHVRPPCPSPTPGVDSNSSIGSVMLPNHLILCRPLLLLPSIFPSIKVFSNESVLHMRWPKYWSFSFSISPSNGYAGLISFRMDWLDLLAPFSWSWCTRFCLCPPGVCFPVLCKFWLLCGGLMATSSKRAYATPRSAAPRAPAPVGKASGGDGIPVELFQILKDDAVKVLHSICQQIWKNQQWPQDWKMSVFIPIPKKGNAKEGSNYHTIELISHTSKVMLRILQARLQQYVNCELPDVKLVLKKAEEPEIKLATSAGSSKKLESSRKTYTSALLMMPKPLTVWVTTNCG